jgi:hypothetical protein
MCWLSRPGNVMRGDFILACNRTILASKTKRDAARTHPCGTRGSLCIYCDKLE